MCLVHRFAIAPLGLTTEGSTKFKLKGWKCYLKKLQCRQIGFNSGGGERDLVTIAPDKEKKSAHTRLRHRLSTKTGRRDAEKCPLSHQFRFVQVNLTLYFSLSGDAKRSGRTIALREIHGVSTLQVSSSAFSSPRILPVERSDCRATHKAISLNVSWPKN